MAARVFRPTNISECTWCAVLVAPGKVSVFPDGPNPLDARYADYTVAQAIQVYGRGKVRLLQRGQSPAEWTGAFLA